MKRQGILWGLMVLTLLCACAAMPVLAEQLIADSANRVMTEAAGPQADGAQADGAQAPLEKRAYTTTVPPTPHPISAQGIKALEARARRAFQETFSERIPDDYAGLDTAAYEEDGELRFVLSLMPPDWERSTDALAQDETRYYYTVGFGAVDVETGDGELISMQRFRFPTPTNMQGEVAPTDADFKVMEASAKAFALSLNMDLGERLTTDLVTGSFETGCILMYDLGGGKTLSITISLDGLVTGYSLVPGKG